MINYLNFIAIKIFPNHLQNLKNKKPTIDYLKL